MLPKELRNVSAAFHFVSEFTETASRAFGSHFHFSESAFVRNCDARVHSMDTHTEPSLSQLLLMLESYDGVNMRRGS